MMRLVNIANRPLVSALALLALGGCAQAPKPLYHWDGYPRELYADLKGEANDPAVQLGKLEEIAAKAKAGGNALPPGFRAHLGLVQLRLGRTADAAQHFSQEKSAFPESAPYMDFLLNRMKGAKP